MADQYHRTDDDLAYGEDYTGSRGYYDQQASTDRGVVGDTFRKLKTRYDQRQKPQQDYGYGSTSTGSSQTYHTSSYPHQGYGSSQPPYTGGPPPPQQPQHGSPYQKHDVADKLFGAVHGAVHSIAQISRVCWVLSTNLSLVKAQVCKATYSPKRSPLETIETDMVAHSLAREKATK